MRRVLAVVVLLWSAHATAHSGVHERVEAISARIAETPNDARLWVDRAELHVTYGHFDAARKDLKRAEELDPQLAAVHLVRGIAAFEQATREKSRRRFQEAVAHFDRFLLVRPSHPKARVHRARSLVQLGRHADAARDLELVAGSSDRPDVFVELAEAHAKAGAPDLAIAAIERGCERLGNLAVFVEAAVETEVARESFDAALKWVARLPAKLRDSPRWLKRSGDYHRAAGRSAQARQQYDRAAAAIAALPAPRRRTPAMRALSSELEQLREP